MSNYFEIIDRIWREEDAFDEVLNGNLFEAIEGLRQIVRGNDPIWAKVVYEILFEYVTGFFLYHFRLSYGNPEAPKPDRQRDLEQHIRKLLHTEARALISKVCMGSLNGNGWQTLHGIRPWRLPFTLNPFKLYRRLVAWMFRVCLHLLGKHLGAEVGLEILSLFDCYTSDEFEELMSYLQRHVHDEWRNLYVVRLMARPQAILPEEHNRLVEHILSIEFAREDTRDQILAELARSSGKALNELVKHKPPDLAEQLVVSAHVNPLSMKCLISSVSSHSFLGRDVNDVFGKLGRLERACAEILLQATLEENLYSSAVLVASHIAALTVEAHELLMSNINSPDLRLRYVAACALLQTARTAPAERIAVFNSIMEIAIDRNPLEITNEACAKRNPLQKMAVNLLLDMAQGDPPLVKAFLIALRNTWRGEFASAFESFFHSCEAPPGLIHELVECVLDGNISEARLTLCLPSYEVRAFTSCLISDALGQIADNELIFYAVNDDGSPVANLIRTCVGYTIRVWPCLALLGDHISSLESPHFAVVAALISLARPDRNEWRPMPLTPSYASFDSKDSFVAICQDLSLAVGILESLDEEYILGTLTDLASRSDYTVRREILRSLRFFPRANPIIMSLIRAGLADSSREVCQAAQESLYGLPYLGTDGVELIIETVASLDEKLRSGMSVDLVERSQPVASSAVPRLKDLLRNSNKVTPDQVHEVWLVEYCLNVLKFVPQESADFAELYRQKLLTNYSNDDLRGHLRPYLILALGRVRPVTQETLEFLLNLLKPGMTKMMIRNIRDLGFPEVKMAAAIALAEIGSDLTNGLDWNMRDNIARHLVWAAHQPIPVDSTFVGGKDIFPKDPNDATYQSAKTMAIVMKTHVAREQVATKGIAPLE